MLLHEAPMDRARRLIIEAERRIDAQRAWIAELTRMGYDTALEAAGTAALHAELRRARAELARLQANIVDP
ncbi:hypothetical protein [Azohydromonas aeria]|uniref:hypothetical protein n=1 Tax=Azohydromonas aeria TaxID=2590212 RepID=UPI0012F7E6D0|nr:hypothetical protein [Azohydromonas aeria]